MRMKATHMRAVGYLCLTPNPGCNRGEVSKD